MRLFILTIGLLLASCGFTPVYKSTGDHNKAAAAFNQIDIAIIKDREGQFLRNALIDRFYQNGYPSAPRYHLVVEDIQEIISDFDITIDSEATRRQLELRTRFQLFETGHKTPLMTRSIIATTSNNVLESEFSTIVTEQSAREAALNDLARQIQRQLAVYFQNNN
jgi:LPS-assembly lipoprotein